MGGSRGLDINRQSLLRNPKVFCRRSLSGIPHEQNEDCIKLAHQVCKLAAVDIKKEKIEIGHRIKNGDIIVKFTDRPTRDQLYANRVNLKNKSIKDIGFHNETSISLN